MKRVTSCVLAVALLMGMLLAQAVTVSADPAADATTETTAPATTDTTDPTTQTTPDTNTGTTTEPDTPTEPEEEKGPSISDECMRILKLEEGFSKYPYWDYSQYTVGYGTRCPDDLYDEYKTNGITEADAEILLRNHLTGVYDDLLKFAEKNSLVLTQNQFDALVLFSYNCGTGWMYDASGTLPTALIKGATGNDLIRAFAVWCNAGGEIKSYLLRRRLSEAYMYLEGGYTQNAPSNYCYVLYDANGGVSKPKSQGYDANLTAAPYPVPTYSGYAFDGWYTQKIGGTKVTKLDMSTKSDTLYAHWKDAQGNDVVEEEKQVNATVTSDGVNVRKGPGTNYTTVGTKNKGDKVLITETASGSGYRWGKFDGGWICLTYTNYDTASQDPEDSDEPDDTTTTPPEDTTEPTTQPTSPTTQPTTKPTTPSTSGSAKVMGTVKVDGYLNVRGGTSTGYPVVGKVQNNERVEILEQKTVGAMTWGRISTGWISMTYVKLDSTASSGTTGSTNTSTQSWTGTIVNCSEWLRIRSGAGTNYTIAGYLYPGDKVTITEQKMNGSTKWGKIDRGWISMDYVKLDSGSGSTGSSSTGSTGTTTSKTGTITASCLCVRKNAGTSSTVVGYLYSGSKVTILQTTTVNGTTWGKTSTGWISMDYVKLDSSTGSSGSSSTGSTTTTQSWTGTISCSEYLNVRAGAGTSYAVSGYMYPGDKVTITEKKQNGSTTWGKTSKGWISLDYVKLDSSSGSTTQQTTTKTVTASCLCVRKTAGTSGTVVSYLYYGTKVSIIETTTVGSTTWGRTSSGWICMDYVK